MVLPKLHVREMQDRDRHGSCLARFEDDVTRSASP
jgi:hypothetical protein